MLPGCTAQVHAAVDAAWLYSASPALDSRVRQHLGPAPVALSPPACLHGLTACCQATAYCARCPALLAGFPPVTAGPQQKVQSIWRVQEGSAPQSTGSTMLDLKMLARRNCPSLHHGDPPATVAAALRGLVHVKLDNERLACARAAPCPPRVAASCLAAWPRWLLAAPAAPAAAAAAAACFM